MKWFFWTGFVCFYAPLYATIDGGAPHGVFIALVVDLPMLAIMLVLLPRTRQFGWGMLLAAVIFFATAVATCGATLE